MDAECRDPHLPLSKKETEAEESMINSDVNENGVVENEASKRARASRKLLVVGIVLVVAAVVLAVVAITVGLTLSGDVRRTIGEKKNGQQLSSSMSTHTSNIPLSTSTTSLPPTSQHSMSENISPTGVISLSTDHPVSSSHTSSLTDMTNTITPRIPNPSKTTTEVPLSTELSPSLSMSVSSTTTPTVSTTMQPLPECQENEFRCNSGQCVHQSAVCNKAINCLDQSDEMFCPGCLTERGFQCDSGLCIWDISRKCNGVFDCGDLSDEQNCPKRSNFFQCSNGVQIFARFRCNGVDDCYDNSDEVNCSRCYNGRVACGNGQCIMGEWKCDGYPDCDDGSDELNCNSCRETDFTCRDYRCVSRVGVCDGEFHCQTGEDEGQCVHLESVGDPGSVTALSVQIKSDRYTVCADGWTDSHSHYICTHRDKAFKFTKFLDVPNTSSPSKFLSLNPGAVFNREQPINTFFYLRSTCPSNQTVALSCARQDCGSRQPGVVVPYVAGGSIASDGRWPWVVSLAYLGQPKCAGALIDQQWIITAAHCVVRPKQLNQTSDPALIEVMAGSVDRLSDISSTVKRLRAVQILRHPDLKEIVPGILDWDAALVKLERPVQFSEYIQPICLPYSVQGAPVTSTCFLAGWGLVNGQQNLFPVRLREAKMLMWMREQCERDTVRQESKVNTNSTLCAGYMLGLPTGCRGDSGGPLMCRDSPGGPWFLAGIMSAGRQACGNSGFGRANRFARVEGMLPWIQQVIYGV